MISTISTLEASVYIAEIDERKNSSQGKPFIRQFVLAGSTNNARTYDEKVFREYIERECLWSARSLRYITEAFPESPKLIDSKNSFSGGIWMTDRVTTEVLHAKERQEFDIFADLWVLRYRDAHETNTNPFHATLVLSHDDLELADFLKHYPYIFNTSYQTLDEALGIFRLDMRYGRVSVMPTIIENLYAKIYGIPLRSEP